jgi:uncharacterized membrane protein YoaK (UPF0700 family)
MQSATVRRVGEQRVATTYVTGTLTTLATDTASDLLDRWRARGTTRAAPAALVHAGRAERGTALMTGLWAVYLLGALVGGFAEYRWSMWAVTAPLAVLIGVIASDLAHRPKEAAGR